MGDFIDSFTSILDRRDSMDAKIDEDLSVVMLLGSMNGQFEFTLEALKPLGNEKLTWEVVCLRLIELSKTSQSTRRDAVALAGRETITFDFCGKRGHYDNQFCQNPDNANNRLDAPNTAGVRRSGNTRKINAKRLGPREPHAPVRHPSTERSRRPRAANHAHRTTTRTLQGSDCYTPIPSLLLYEPACRARPAASFSTPARAVTCDTYILVPSPPAVRSHRHFSRQRLKHLLRKGR
jgi:hypothetical protein